MDELVRVQADLGILRNPGHIRVDGQRGNDNDYRAIVERMCETYRTSKTSMRIRLQQLEIVHDVRPDSERDMGHKQFVMGDILSEIVRTLTDRNGDAT